MKTLYYYDRNSITPYILQKFEMFNNLYNK